MEPSPIHSLRSVTIGEDYFIRRRRLKFKQSQMADKYGLNLQRYKEIENLNTLRIGGSEMRLSNLEWCVIQRRRCGWTQPQLAKLMDVSRQSVLMMEMGHTTPKKLLYFWDTYKWQIHHLNF